MTDKEIVERAKEAEKRTGFGELVHSPISKGVNSAFGIGFIEGMVEYRNSLQEEPVSEDLDSFAIKYAQDKPYPVTVCQAVKVGANWQEQKDESYTKSMYKVGINTGKELMKQQLMTKAVDVTVHIDAGGYPYIPQMELYDYDKDIPLAKEGDKYKVILIKEDCI